MNDRCLFSNVGEEPKPSPTPQHQSYIVRIWPADSGRPARISAQNVTDGVRVYFATLEELFAHFWRVSQAQSTDTQE